MRLISDLTSSASYADGLLYIYGMIIPLHLISRRKYLVAYPVELASCDCGS